MKALDFLKHHSIMTSGYDGLVTIARDYSYGKERIVTYRSMQSYNEWSKFKFTQKGLEEAFAKADKLSKEPEIPEKESAIYQKEIFRI